MNDPSKPPVEETEKSAERKPIVISRMTEDALRTFVNDCVSGKILTAHHLNPVDVPRVFMLIGLGALEGHALSEIGTIYEYYDRAGPISCNDLPMFFSMRVLHVKDWERAKKAIAAEQERRKAIDLPPEEACLRCNSIPCECGRV